MAIIQQLESRLGENETTFGMVDGDAAVRARGEANVESTADTREGGEIVQLMVLQEEIPVRNALI
jgi:hypothetical protein